MKGHGKEDASTRNGPGKFVAGKLRAAHTSLSQQSTAPLGPGMVGTMGSSYGGPATTGIGQHGSGLSNVSLSEKDIQVSQ